MKKIKLEAHKKSNYGSMTSFENPFQWHEKKRQPLDWDEYDIETRIFDDSSYFAG